MQLTTRQIGGLNFQNASIMRLTRKHSQLMKEKYTLDLYKFTINKFNFSKPYFIFQFRVYFIYKIISYIKIFNGNKQ